MISGPNFLTPLAVEPMSDGENWRLTRPLKFADATGAVHIVPAGFITDFASIPDLARISVWLLCLLIPAGWWLLWNEHWKWFCAESVVTSFALWVAAIAYRLNHDELVDPGATVHDYYYRVIRKSRAHADRLLFEGMTATNRPLWKKLIIWGNVRLFGWSAWRNDGRIAKL